MATLENGAIGVACKMKGYVRGMAMGVVSGLPTKRALTQSPDNG